MTRAFSFGEPLKLFQIPLMVENQGVTLWSPTMKIFFASNICIGSVQDSPLAALQSLKRIYIACLNKLFRVLITWTSDCSFSQKDLIDTGESVCLRVPKSALEEVLESRS